MSPGCQGKIGEKMIHQQEVDGCVLLHRLVKLLLPGLVDMLKSIYIISDSRIIIGMLNCNNKILKP